MKLIVIKKNTCKKASLVLHAFVSAMGMYMNLYINLIPAMGKGGGGGGGKRVLHKRTMGQIIVNLRT